MEFTFKVQEPNGINIEVFVYVEGVLMGRLVLITEEWTLLKAMLLHGSTWFQRDEGTIAIEERSAVPAFLTGV